MKTARVTVQFQSVTEKLSPYDTVFAFTQSAELKDSALSSACSLHTATASTKSSVDSLPQRGLAGITEDASETRVDTVEGGVVPGSTARDEEHSSGAEEAKSRPDKVNGFSSADRSHHRNTSVTTQSSFRPRTTSNTDKPLPPPPPPEDHAREHASPESILDYGDYDKKPSMDERFSSNSTRPSTRDLYDAYGYKKKTKMGPRPSTDSVGAPNNIDSRTDDFRPVSTLPAGLRMPSRKAVPTRPASRQSHANPPTQASSPIKFSPPAQTNSPDNITPKKPATATVGPIHIPDRNLSMLNNGLRTPKMTEPGSPKMTPEKQRLMKALQLRQKQIAMQGSVNVSGIKSVSEEPEFTKPEIDASILSAVIDTSSSTEGPAPDEIATKDLAKEDSRLLGDSPISMPETVEEPSTKASSITDEEESAAQKQQENLPSSIPVRTENQDQPPVNLLRNSQSQSIGSQEVAPTVSEKEVLTRANSIESVKHLRQPSAPAQSENFLADTNLAEHKAAGKDLPESGQHDRSPIMGGDVLDKGNTVSAEDVSEDKQLLPSQLLEGQALDDDPMITGGPLLFDQRIAPTTSFNKNAEVQQISPTDDHEKVTSTEKVSQNKDLSQSQRSGDHDRDYSTVNSTSHPRVPQSQSEERHRQSLEHPVQNSVENAPWEFPEDIVKPLLVRRSSSSKSITVPFDTVNAHEVPLPPIDEDEEISLSPQRALFREPASTLPALDTNSESKAAITQAEPPSQDNDPSATRSSASNDVCERQTERRFRNQKMINPTKRVSSPDQSDEHFLSDDSFMEELKSATVQEAKPVSVSKSPIKPVFSRSESEQRLNESVRGSRSVSTPVDRTTKDEEVFTSPRLPTPLSTSGSVSAQHPPRPDSQQSQAPISKKIGMSTSISQRIKALEQLSSRPTSPISPNLAPNTSTFLGLRKTSLRTPSGGSDYKNNDFNRNRPSTAYPTPSPSPETIRSSLLNHSNKPDFSRPAQSVITTTVRDARTKSPETISDLSERHQQGPQGNLLQREHPKSPPPADHKTMMPPPLSPLKPPRPRFGRYSSTRSGSSSSNEQKLEPPSTTRRESFASIRSKSSRAGSEVELPRTLSDSSLSGVASLDGSQDEKKDSRRSRLLKRMSSISSMSRRSIAHALSPGPKEAPIIERQEPVPEAPSTSVEVGDVNVQFPDNLVSNALNFLFNLAEVVSSFGKDDTWSLTRTAS